MKDYIRLLILTIFILTILAIQSVYAKGPDGISLTVDKPRTSSSTTFDAQCKMQDGTIFIDFEGLSDTSSVGDAYSSCGAYFSADSLSLIDYDAGGNGNFANEPSPNTILFFLDSDRATLNFPDGIRNGFSFYYCSCFYAGFINVYSETDRQGELLATLELPITPQLGLGDPNGTYDNWVNIGVAFQGIAKSIDFGGTANQIGFDNITLSSAVAADTKVTSFDFIFSPAGNQQVNTNFQLTLTARDLYGNRVNSFNSKIDLTTNYGTFVAVEDERGVVFSNGQWTGNVKIIQPFTGVKLIARYIEISSESIAFDVTGNNVLTGNIIGSVKLRADDSDVIGATVQLFKDTDQETPIDEKTTGINGFKFLNIPARNYIVKAFSPNSPVSSASVCLKGGTQEITLYLTTTGKKPLIFVPGILASTVETSPDDEIYPLLTKERKPSQDKLKPLDPNYHSIRLMKIKEFFEDYKNDFEVIYAPYDWRLSLDEIWPEYLQKKIDAVKKDLNWGGKVDIIAHSMGGLVTRAYIQSAAYKTRNDIDKFVMIGTPNEGSGNTYMIDEGGEPKRIDDLTDEWTSSWINVYDSSMKNAWGLEKSTPYGKAKRNEIKEFVNTKVLSLRQIAPTYNYLYVKGGTDNPISATMSINSWLAALNKNSNIKRMVADLDDSYCQESGNVCVPTRLLLTNACDTINGINVLQDAAKDGTYPSGEPYDPWGFGNEIKTEKNGDGTVLAAQAAAPFDGNIVKTDSYDKKTHAFMLTSSDIRDVVYTFITGNSRSKAQVFAIKEAAPEIPASKISLYIEGNVQPYVTDKNSSSVGVNIDNGMVDKNITGSNVVLIDGSSLITIDNPMSGDYAVALKGPFEEDFRIVLVYYDNEGENRVEKTARGLYHGGVLKFKINLDKESNQKIMIIGPAEKPENIAAYEAQGETQLTWSASSDPNIIGYNIYSRTSAQPLFICIGNTDTLNFNTAQSWNTDNSTGIERFYVVVAVKPDGSESFYDYTVENKKFILSNFKADKLSGGAPLTVQFQDQSEGEINSWNWDFESDGQVDSTEQNPTFTYQNEGLYTITLTVSGANGSDIKTKTNYIIVRNGAPLYLKKGWNLISMNLQPFETDIQKILGSIYGKYLSVWSYNNNSWKVYNPDYSDSSDLKRIDAGIGYWICMQDNATLIVAGTQPPNTISLLQGWNLVGYNASNTQDIGTSFASIAGKYISVWGFKDGQWLAYDPNYPEFSDLTFLEPGYGYWINATENCTWSLNGTQSASMTTFKTKKTILDRVKTWWVKNGGTDRKRVLEPPPMPPGFNTVK